MTHIEAADPENDVFGNVGGMIGDALKMSGGQDELHPRTHESGLLGHSFQQLIEDSVSILIHDIVTLKDLPSQFYIAKDKGAKALADHGLNGRCHGAQFL